MSLISPQSQGLSVPRVNSEKNTGSSLPNKRSWYSVVVSWWPTFFRLSAVNIRWPHISSFFTKSSECSKPEDLAGRITLVKKEGLEEKIQNFKGILDHQIETLKDKLPALDTSSVTVETATVQQLRKVLDKYQGILTRLSPEFNKNPDEKSKDPLSSDMKHLYQEFSLDEGEEKALLLKMHHEKTNPTAKSTIQDYDTIAKLYRQSQSAYEKYEKSHNPTELNSSMAFLQQAKNYSPTETRAYQKQYCLEMVQKIEKAITEITTKNTEHPSIPIYKQAKTCMETAAKQYGQEGVNETLSMCLMNEALCYIFAANTLDADSKQCLPETAFVVNENDRKADAIIYKKAAKKCEEAAQKAARGNIKEAIALNQKGYNLFKLGTVGAQQDKNAHQDWEFLNCEDHRNVE